MKWVKREGGGERKEGMKRKGRCDENDLMHMFTKMTTCVCMKQTNKK